MRGEGAESGRQVEAMTAEQAEVVSQDMAIERLTELSTQSTATNPGSKAAEDGARHGTQGDADRAGERADSCTRLTTGEGSADASRNTAHSADGRADFHGVMEGSDFGGVTSRALQRHGEILFSDYVIAVMCGSDIFQSECATERYPVERRHGGLRELRLPTFGKQEVLAT